MSTADIGRNSTKVSVATKNLIPNDDFYHINDFIKTFHVPIKVVPIHTYLAYMSRTLKNLLSTLIFNWSMAFVQPLNFLVLVTLVPLLSIALLIIGITFHIGFALGMGNVIDAIGRKWGGNLTLINWWDPRIFTSDVDEIVKNGITALERSLEVPTNNSDKAMFDIDIAELLLFMSSVIYERNEKIVRETYDMISMTDIQSEEDLEPAITQLKESESRIHAQARLWGLEFISLSELNSLGGPFAGIFYSKERNFIVVVFKGTTPTDFNDFVTNLMLQRVDANSFVFGEIHEGMYTSLFSQTEGHGVKMSRTSPYITIVEAIRMKAADIVNSKVSKTPVNIWVTGHSLGGALASIFFARCLKSPEDLGSNCILRDGYMFGCPAIGNSSFASLFSSYSNNPFDRASTLWRVVNDTDIIAHLSGIEDAIITRALTEHSLLDYTHVGEEIRFFRNGARPKCTREVLTSVEEQSLVENNEFDLFNSGKRFTEDVFRHPSKYVKNIVNKNPLEYVKMLMPTFYRNHIPAEYFKAMQKSRRYFDNNRSTS